MTGSSRNQSVFEGKREDGLRFPPPSGGGREENWMGSLVGMLCVNSAGTGDGAGCDDASTTSAPGWCHLKS